MSHRPLATVCGLTIGDYLLWNWSLNANHAALALVSGLTLPPLAIAFVWLLVLTLARFVASTSRDARDARARKPARATARVPAARRGASPRAGVASNPAARASTAASAAPASSSARASRKIAA